MENSKYQPSYTSPKGGTRGCLCKDKKTYSRKCCDGSLWAQGIGNIYASSTQFFLIQENSDLLLQETTSKIKL